LLPLVLLIAIRSNGRRYVIGLIAITGMWLLVICGLGRMNLILFAGGFTAVALSVFLVPRLRRYRLKLVWIALALVIVPLGVSILPSSAETGSVATASSALGTQAKNDSNNFRLLMATLSFEMIKADPVIGVGADNFGYEVNKYREMYGAAHPDDVNLAQAEKEIPERAHNEYLQIVAELGVVGGLIFLWFLIGIGSMLLIAITERKLSPIRLAAFLGVLIFLASSLVTSFSFRLVQNGFVFFFLLAICTRYFLRAKPAEKTLELSNYRGILHAAAAFCCILLLAYCGIRVSSVIATEKANFEPDLAQARPNYEFAISLDRENPNAFNNYGMRLFSEGRYDEAVPFLLRAIDVGRGTSIDFSYLASAQSLAGDNLAAEETMARALRMYPRSPFVLTRYAALQRTNGRVEDSERCLERARSIDLRASNTWWAMINKGSKAASALGFKNNDFSAIMDLQPQPAVYAVLAERDVRFPGEREKLPFQ
jgi:tetratricopeptide (TPR) repeat protein